MAVFKRSIHLSPSGFSSTGLGSHNISATQRQSVKQGIVRSADRPFQIGLPRSARALRAGQPFGTIQQMVRIQGNGSSAK